MQNLVLLIDDDREYCLKLQKEAHNALLELIFAHNLEEGIDLIDSNRRIKAVILDGHCFLESGQNGSPKANFVYHALHHLDNLERTQNRIIPRCVNSEKSADFNEELQGLIPVFSKNTDSNILFRWTRQSINELVEVQVMEKHPAIFENSGLIFSDLEEDELVDLILFADNCDESDIPARLAIIRRLLERLTDVCAECLLDTSADVYANMMGVSVKPVFDALRTKKIIPAPLTKQVRDIYSYCSEFGNHIHPEGKPEYSPDAYAYRRNLNGFLEVVSYCSLLIEPSNHH